MKPSLPLSSQPQFGGVVMTTNSGAVSLTDSFVTGCAAEVRHVAVSLQRRTAAGR